MGHTFVPLAAESKAGATGTRYHNRKRRTGIVMRVTRFCRSYRNDGKKLVFLACCRCCGSNEGEVGPGFSAPRALWNCCEWRQLGTRGACAGGLTVPLKKKAHPPPGWRIARRQNSVTGRGEKDRGKRSAGQTGQFQALGGKS